MCLGKTERVFPTIAVGKGEIFPSLIHLERINLTVCVGKIEFACFSHPQNTLCFPQILTIVLPPQILKSTLMYLPPADVSKLTMSGWDVNFRS